MLVGRGAYLQCNIVTTCYTSMKLHVQPLYCLKRRPQVSDKETSTDHFMSERGNIDTKQTNSLALSAKANYTD
jgi:hypothetical protein